MSQIDFILGPADLTIHRVTGWDHPSVDQSQDQAETLSRRAFTLKWRCCLDERMDLEISRITDCASWHTVVGMEYSTEFDKCSSPVNWEEPKTACNRYGSNSGFERAKSRGFETNGV